MLVAAVRLRGRKRKGSVLRFAPESSRITDIGGRLKCATTGHNRNYSITLLASSASGRQRAKTDVRTFAGTGTSMPRQHGVAERTEPKCDRLFFTEALNLS